MKQECYFALYAIKKNLQSSAELRASFLMNIVGMALNNIALVILWVFFVRSVGVVNGWTAADIIALQGFTSLSFGLVFSVAAGIRKLPEYVTSGAFDRFLLSPKNLYLRLATASFGVSALGDVLFGIVALALYLVLIQASFYQVVLLVLLLGAATLVFLAVATAIYSVSFWLTDAVSASNSLFELFITPALFHGGLFQGALRFLFTFVIPSLLIGTLPVEALRDVDLPKLFLLLGLAILWFLMALYLFHRAVRRYESANFIHFGS